MASPSAASRCAIISRRSTTSPQPARDRRILQPAAATDRRLCHGLPQPGKDSRPYAIHPFADGNGRTARLLTNPMLLRQSYPPVAVRTEDRIAYLDALERASDADVTSFQALMHVRLDTTLDADLNLPRQALPSG